MTWTHVFADLEPSPVLGEVDDYLVAASTSTEAALTAERVASEFARIVRSEAVGGLRGRSADALLAVVSEVDTRLGAVPPVFESLAAVFAAHHESLEHLQQRSAEALARATTRWHDRCRAADTADEHARLLDRITWQIDSLQSRPPTPETDELIESAERRHRGQQALVRFWHDQVDQAEIGLAASRIEYGHLIDDEHDVVARTVARLGGIDLGELADPGRLQQFASALATEFEAFGRGLVDGLEELGREALGVLLEGLERLTALAEIVLVESLRVLALAIVGALILVAAVVVAALLAAAVIVLALAIALGGSRAVAALVYASVTLRRALNAPDPRVGDRGGTYTGETRTYPASTYPASPSAGSDRPIHSSQEIGRGLITDALRATGQSDLIAQDEIGLVRTDDGKFIVILPGVTDLSRPDLGLSDFNRSVRDLDQGAFGSSHSIGIDGNVYAQMVLEALQHHGVPPGSEIMIVGHSYGADTALDLAADPRFNGPTGYLVSHVVAAGYNSGPQLPHVPGATNALVLQNSNDLAIGVENRAYDTVGFVDEFGSALGSFIDRDPGDGFGHLVGAVGHARGTPSNVMVPGVTTVGEHVTAVFDGGSEGFGHHQNNYIAYLDTHTDPAVAAFETSVGEAGFGTPRDLVCDRRVGASRAVSDA